jgi:hypothetical protein
MSGDLHFIFWVSVFGIVFNLIVTFIKNKSEVFKSIVKKADLLYRLVQIRNDFADSFNKFRCFSI